MSIPKLIHYCWFGKKPLPNNCKKMIASWQKFLPDYQIMCWDETTFDVTVCAYVQSAYAAGKYAFVSDYARLFALHKFGGVYLDTDIEAVRSFDSLLQGHSAVFGFESGEKAMTAFMAAQPEHPIIAEFLDYYTQLVFDPANLEPNTVPLTEILERRGLVKNNTEQVIDGDVAVFPLDYFQAYDFTKAVLCVTEKTCTVHRCYGSWCSPKERMLFAVKRLLGKCLSEEAYGKLKRIKKKFMGD